MQHSEKTAEVLEDLVKINNDRIEGYQKAIKQTDDGDLKILFDNMVADSKNFTIELNKELRTMGEERERDTTIAGKIYRTWMDVKVSFGGNDRHAILASCEYGEDAAQKSYREALAQDYLPENIRSIITDQQRTLKASHDQIRHMRDVEAVNK
ncbi:PA2169 family four-helix-bundle protein [Chitinophaga sp. SYP-B3965]|uniref:ferritin-like domain-containing protein n=1 Tax=Chitinophaga sp. SYP-B3965 TaxID=2663120 RepID=UPI001299F0EA|nr:PA2169 family four-helix-bundle protein [Chitinophaga sp. SYP-B3965]MRG46655.1 PA2169 family four-helix-bundle protein [Chitinophaga sp. SYP-B3965]